MWAGILLLAVVNGAFREIVLNPQLGQLSGFIISGIILSFLVVYVAYLTFPWLAIKKQRTLFFVGLGWLVLTLVFEFSAGLLQGKSFSMLCEAYRFKDGNIWPVVLAVTTAAPYLADKLRNLRGR